MEQARKHRVGKAVRFVGPVDHTELVTLMHRCDAIVLPSRYEPFGIVALEAAATGVPLIVSTAGGLGEAVREPDTGLTFEPADVAGLAAAVRAAGGEIVEEAGPQHPDRTGPAIWATGAPGLAALGADLGRPVGGGVKGQSALLRPHA